MTKCIKRIRDLFKYALYKFTLYLLTLLYLYCISLHSECEEQLDHQRSELSHMRTYLTESEDLSQSTDVLRKEIVDLKNRTEVSSFCFLELLAIKENYLHSY